MKIRLPFLALALLLPSHAALAQEQLVNGDFETGALTPWTVTAGSASVSNSDPLDGNYSVLFSGNNTNTIQQEVPTVVGTRYYLSGETLGMFPTTLSATPLNGNTPDGTVSLSNGFKGVVFTASATITVVSASDSPFIGSGSADDLSLLELAPFSHPGRYTGTATSLLTTNGSPALTQKGKDPVVAQIGADNTITILQAGHYLHSGLILNDGTLILELAGTKRVHGTATITAKTITFTIPDYSTTGQTTFTDQDGNTVGSASLSFKLTRTGK